MDKETAAELIRFRMPAHADRIIPYLHMSQRLHPEPVQQIPRVTDSHFGDAPALPDDVEWPTWDKRELVQSEINRQEKRRESLLANGKTPGKYFEKHMTRLREQLQTSVAPLSFIVQIKLDEQTRIETDLPLPTSGSLCFFYDMDKMPWGFDPACRGGWRVLHVDRPDDQLKRREVPANVADQSSVKPAHIRVEAQATVPDDLREETGIAELQMFDDGAFAQLHKELLGEDGPTVHRLGGWPSQIQGDMRWTCQLASNGIYCSNSSVESDPRVAELAAGVKDWKLLLQIDSDDSLGMMWGDVGRIYFWMREDDIANRCWDRAWFDLQCY